MTKRIRNFLFSIFTLLFLSLSAWVLLYAFGYQINWQSMRLTKTGMFVVKTNPSGATIYLNGEPQNSFFKSVTGQEDLIKSPAKISNLKPGLYDVKLELDGYWPWQKQLAIRPNESTYLEDVRLFRKELPFLIGEIEIDNLIDAVKSGNKVAALTQQSIKIIDLQNQTSQTIEADFALNDFKLTLSPNGNKVAAGSFIINLDSGESYDVFADNDTKPQKVIWSGNSDDIFYQINQTVWQHTLSSRTSKMLFSASNGEIISDLLYKNENLLAISSYPALEESRLSIINTENGSSVGYIALPYSDYEFTNRENRWVNLYDNTRQRLMVLEIIWPWAAQYNIKTFSHLQEGRWISDDKLLYTNGFEIRLWERSSNQSRLLTRLSQEITDLMWHPHRNYIIFATNTSIRSLELDDRYSHNLTSLIELDKIKFPFLNNNGNTVYFFSSIGRQSGLYQLNI